MKTYLGTSGLDKSWQAKFKANIKCKHCGKNARIMFVAFEKVEKEYVCNLHPNTCARKGGKFWAHDAIAVAVYACEKCYEVSAEMNQA